MTPERWQCIKGVLAEALEHRDATDRRAFVERACADDPQLRQAVESLLAREATGLDQFAERVGGVHQQTAQGGTHAGRRIGAYELTRELGRGGMGVVWLARRADGRFEQQVAVKLLKRGTDTDEVLRRFRAERRILARLEHPNIARLLDGGETDDGLPFFVLEYVDGVPLTAFANERDLPVRARLELFTRVCATVQFAHQNLVVHRDLKPGNILVTGDGEPKLLDFGLARLLGPEEGNESGLTITQAESRRLTPAYASPEQVRGAALTTASDVYSLGALLYELLTGVQAHRFDGPHPPPVELLRVIGEQEPLRPSLVSHPEMGYKLRGDLDNIVGLAMRKDPARRYQSVGALTDDLRRHLDDRPVRARADTWRYRMEKFVRRNRSGVAVGTLILVAALAAGALVAREAREATREARRAERRFNEVRSLAHSFLFEFSDSIHDVPGTTGTRRLLATRALEYLERLEREAGADLSLRHELVEAYIKVGDVQGQPDANNVGDTDGALASYRHATAIAEDLPDDDASAVLRASAWDALGNVLANRANGRDEALRQMRRALAVRERLAARAPADAALRREVARSLFSIGDTLLADDQAALSPLKNIKEAQECYTRILDLFERNHAEQPAPADARQLASVHYRLGSSFKSLAAHASWDPGLLAQSLDHYRRCVSLLEENLALQSTSGPARRALADTLTMKAGVQTRLGDPAGALTDCRRGIEMFAALSAADPANAWARQDLAFAHFCAATPRRAIGDLAGAIESLDQSAAIYEALFTADPASLIPVEHLNSIWRLRTEICAALGDTDGTRESAQRWVQCSERLTAASPTDEALQADLMQAHARVMATNRESTGDGKSSLPSPRSLPVSR